jgi:multidrug efflux pump subunit AcrA (membrane-fusion protein)
MTISFKNSQIVYLLAGVLVVATLFPVLSFAHHEPIVDPGMTPDNPFYFLKSWREQIQVFLTFNAGQRARQHFHLASVRLAEYQKMIEQGKAEVAERTLSKYEAQLARALENLEDLKPKSRETRELAEEAGEATMLHLEVLQENLDRAPEQARAGLERALEASRRALEREEDQAAVTVNLSEGNNSGEAGVAKLSPLANGTRTKVSLELTGAPSGTRQPAHIHSGSCPEVGGVKYPLNFPTDGRSETVLDVSLDQLKAELPLAINVHKSVPEAAVYVSCGDLNF